MELPARRRLWLKHQHFSLRFDTDFDEMRCCFLLSSIFVALPAQRVLRARTPQAKPVTIQVFDESMCPYCHVFFDEALSPIWDQVKDVVDVQLYPAGNLAVQEMAKVSDGYHFWHPVDAAKEYLFQCQHGEAECLGNHIHMCVDEMFPDKALDLVFCMVSPTYVNSSIELSSYACMQSLQIDVDQVKACVESPAKNLRIGLADYSMWPGFAVRSVRPVWISIGT